MSNETISAWIPHLTNEYALTGFALFTVAGLSWLFKGLSFGQLSGAATERLLTKLIIGCVFLGVLSVVFGFGSEMQKHSYEAKKQSQPAASSQIMEGVKNSTAVQAGCDAVAAADGLAKRSGSSGGTQQPINQTMKNIEGSTVAQGGCGAVASGKAATE